MKLLGLIGFPLSHSFSMSYFANKFSTLNLENEYRYEKFEIENVEQCKDIFNKPDFLGCNVTIPYKKSIIQFIDEIDSNALEINAINTIVKQSNGKLKGYNTDWVGFARSLTNLNKTHIEKALILGSGGSSVSVAYALDQLGIEYNIVSRNPNQANHTSYEIANELLPDVQLVINTTPVGMFPNIDKMPPIDYNSFSKNHVYFDLIYNPSETELLKKVKKKGALVMNGIEMLKYQADAAWELWMDV